MIRFILLMGIALATMAFAAPASAMCMKGCTVTSDFTVGSIAGAGGLNGIMGGTVKNRVHESGTGTINEADLTIKIDEDGIKKIDGTFHSGGYGFNENSVKSVHVGTGASGSLSGSVVTGGMDVGIDIQKN